MEKSKLLRGTSADGILLTLIKLLTVLVSFAITRLLSEHLTEYDYGTYSQILLIVSTVSSVTILGMMDGVNYFFCGQRDVQLRERYISTLFCLQCLVGTLAGTVLMLLTLFPGFENPEVRKLMIFAAVLPLLQNLLSMIQILLVSVGKAKMLAARNLLIALLRLLVVIIVVMRSKNVAVILITTLLLDVSQVFFFLFILRRNQCGISLKKVTPRLAKQILIYCVPMGLFIMINTLNRDLDKYLILWLTDTETLALYTNASKMLPFDVIMSSFCTVLLPQITQRIAAGEKKKATELYKLFLEIAYIPTTIMCCAVLAAAPQTMELLYSTKYLDGLPIFCVYVFVDMLRFMNITLILSAAGKTKKLFLFGLVSLAANFLLNFLLYYLLGIVGPAVATLLVTFGSGLLILGSGARELDSRLSHFFDLKYFLVFLAENVAALVLFSLLRQWLQNRGVHYLVILAAICVLYCGVMLLLHGRHLIHTLKQVNKTTS